MNNETIMKEYEGKSIRCVYENNKCYYSIIDVIGILNDSKDNRKYWNKLKQRLKENCNELVTKCHQLKLKSSDGKYYLTDVIENNYLIDLINVIPSQNKSKFIKWLEKDKELANIKNSQITFYNGQKITNLIYEIRGREVMLDSDLANLYGFFQGTKALNQAVKRNIERFPLDFYFQLTEEEYLILRSQSVTANKTALKNRSRPYVFTEQGVAMLATILRTKVASEVSINIMRAFVIMRKYISNELIEQRYVNKQVFKNSEDIKALQELFKKLEEKRKNNEIYFNGQIYDAYSKIVDIFKKAKKELIIIDGYADKVVLDMIREIKVPVKIICHKNKLLKDIDIKKYQSQYNNLKVIFNNSYHDRYFIIDNSEVFHCGTSLNHIGEKTFSINLLTDEDIKKILIKKVDYHLLPKV